MKPKRKVPKRKLKPFRRKRIKPSWNMLPGNCLERMGDIPDGSVHTVITSPPYWGMRDYGVDEQHGLEETLDDWLDVQIGVFEQVRRILRDDGTLWLNIGDNYVGGELVGQPWALALAMKRAGWILRADIIWSKPNPIPQPSRKRPSLSHEYIFLFVKSSNYFYDDFAVRERSLHAGLVQKTRKPVYRGKSGARSGGLPSQPTVPTSRNLRTVWSIPAGGQAQESHFAAFPERLPEICIKAGTSEKGCCEVCGAPWTRIIEKTELGQKLLGKEWHDRSEALKRGHRNAPPKAEGELYRSAGWKPGCDCGLRLAPCRVFDPYAGTGTTGRVALSLGRSFTGIELNPEWYKAACKRLAEGSSRGGVVTEADLETRAQLGMMTDLERNLFGM